MDDRIEQYYFKNARRGLVLTVDDLKRFAKAENIKLPPDKLLRELRHEYKYLAIHSRWTRPANYMSPSIPRIGALHTDIMEFHHNLRAFNKNRSYILVGIDSLTQRAGAIAYPNKSQRSWEDGVTHFIDTFPSVHCILSDRDTAVSGEAFQRRILKQKNVKWLHLRSRSKAYLAERFIRYLKNRLQISLDLGKPDLNWLQYLDGIIADYNDRFCRGTKLKRGEITKKHELEVIRQQFRAVGDVTPLFNTSVITNFSPYMRKKLKFRFKENDLVQLSTSANYMLRKKGFDKKSITGNFSKKYYRVVKCMLKANSNYFYTCVYKLANLNGDEIHGVFYDTELSPAKFALKNKKQEAYHEKVQREQSAEEASESIKNRLRKIAKNGRK